MYQKFINPQGHKLLVSVNNNNRVNITFYDMFAICYNTVHTQYYRKVYEHGQNK